MVFKAREILEKIAALETQMNQLQHEAEMSRTVLMVKEPDAVRAAEAYEGLRKQVIASSTSRRMHLTQLAQMAVAVSRAATVNDLRGIVAQWLEQAAVVALDEVPEGFRAQDLFESIDGARPASIEGMVVIEPAYVDAQNSVILRTGRVDERRPRPVDRTGATDGVPDEPARLAAPPAPGVRPSQEEAE
jgi:hypothetical protein